MAGESLTIGVEAGGRCWFSMDWPRPAPTGTPRSSSGSSANELILLDNRGIGASTDNGAPFDIDQLADDTVRVIEGLGFEHASVLGWSLGGFIAQTPSFGASGPYCQLILLSTDPGGVDAELHPPLFDRN
jgi:pimeloyl-ACP methyl ester carboxylesterase